MSLKVDYLSHSADETLAYAKEFAKTLKPGDILALEGNLGAGKTTFIKGIALGLGLKHADEVKSPTFVLMHIYPSKIPIYHFDLYRLDKPEELQAIGFEEYIYDPKSVSCIEWAEKAGDIIPARAYKILMNLADTNSRSIRITQGENA